LVNVSANGYQNGYQQGEQGDYKTPK